MNQYDQRQLQLMKEMIGLFRNGKIALPDLISKIEALIDELVDIELQWKENLRSLWANLELTYAYMLHTGRETLNGEEEREIAEIVNTINRLIDEKVREENEKPNFPIRLKAENLENNWLMCPVCIDAWQSESKVGMVMCPKCKTVMHNPNAFNFVGK